MDLCDRLGWVEFFVTHHGGLGQKIPSTRPIHTPTDKGILNAFTTTVDLTKRVTKTIDDEEYLVDFKFKKMDDQDDIHIAYAKLYKVSKKHEKLYRLATKKLTDVELDREELSTKVVEANQTIGALRFKNKEA